MRIAGIRKSSLFDNIGINYTIFAQGCPHACEGCHNPSTHDPEGGYEVTFAELKADISSLQLIQGVTFSGGEPMEQMDEVLQLAQWCKQQGLQVTLYTGYTVEKYCDYLYFNDRKGKMWKSLAPQDNYFDYIIDGKFDISKKTVDMPFRGSSNQRILKKGVDY